MTTHQLDTVDKKCYLKLVGCETNVATSGVVTCTKCSVTHHLIAKKCQAKVIPSGCDGYANTDWKDGAEYCNLCKSTHYTYEGKCIIKTTLAGCDANS